MNINSYLQRKTYSKVSGCGPNHKNPCYQREVVKLAFVWCSEIMGDSKYHLGFPTLRVLNKRCSEYKGHYDEVKNEIVVYLKNHRSPLDLCRTVIHEWKHYQQNVLVMYDVYLRVYKRKIENHPYEISAEKSAIKLGGKCKTWVVKVIKTNNND